MRAARSTPGWGSGEWQRNLDAHGSNGDVGGINPQDVNCAAVAGCFPHPATGLRDEHGRRLVVRNGSHQPRTVLTSAGAVDHSTHDR
jgi:hypothetical protein